MAYESSKIAVKAEAIASAGEISAAGGKRTLKIKNHLIQTVAKAQSVADAYLLEYKTQKLRVPIKPPYRDRDIIGD